jgi:hypothetical protein
MVRGAKRVLSYRGNDPAWLKAQAWLCELLPGLRARRLAAQEGRNG